MPGPRPGFFCATVGRVLRSLAAAFAAAACACALVEGDRLVGSVEDSAGSRAVTFVRTP